MAPDNWPSSQLHAAIRQQAMGILPTTQMEQPTSYSQ